MKGSVRGRSSRAITSAARKLLEDYPYVTQLFPHMLERGDHQARKFVINFTGMVETPGSAAALLEFALGQYGSDDLRMEALQLISQEHPERLPEDRKVAIWQHGRRTEIILMDFEIYEEPEPPTDLPDDVIDKFEEAHDLLMDDEPEEAERLLKEVIAAAPDFSSAYNQLAVVYEMQGRREEAQTLVEETHARFPDYLFARVALARMYVLDKRIEEAKELVLPLLQHDRLHVSEFRALAQAQMEIALAEGQKEGARTWLNMWAEVEDDHPDLQKWELRIEGQESMVRRLAKLLGQDDV
jgi:tetratricopeptide (TPR) repeat protein